MCLSRHEVVEGTVKSRAERPATAVSVLRLASIAADGTDMRTHIPYSALIVQIAALCD